MFGSRVLCSWAKVYANLSETHICFHYIIPVKSKYMQTWVGTVLKFMDTIIWAKAFSQLIFGDSFQKMPRIWSHRWVSDLQCQPAFPGRFGCHLVCLQWPPGGRLRGPGLLQQRAPRAPRDDEPGKDVAAAVPGASGADAVCSGRVLHPSPGGGFGGVLGGNLGRKNLAKTACNQLHICTDNLRWENVLDMYLTIRL